MTETSSETDAARELTMLAWRRTALRWVVVAVVAARVLSDDLGIGVVVVALLAIAAAWLVSLAARREFSHMAPSSDSATPTLPGTVRRPTPRLAIATVGTLLVGLVSLWWVVAG